MHTERTQILLSPEQRSRVERIAARENRSMGAVIRDAIDAYTGLTLSSREEAFQALISMNAPVADWDQMKAEIIEGALGE